MKTRKSLLLSSCIPFLRLVCVCFLKLLLFPPCRYYCPGLSGWIRVSCLVWVCAYSACCYCLKFLDIFYILHDRKCIDLCYWWCIWYGTHFLLFPRVTIRRTTIRCFTLDHNRWWFWFVSAYVDRIVAVFVVISLSSGENRFLRGIVGVFVPVLERVPLEVGDCENIQLMSMFASSTISVGSSLLLLILVALLGNLPFMFVSISSIFVPLSHFTPLLFVFKTQLTMICF